MNRISEIREYLKTWGYLKRIDGVPKMYSQVDWGGLVGENDVFVPDAIMQRVCFYMSSLIESKPEPYAVCYTIYVKRFDTERTASKELQMPRQTLSRHRYTAELGLCEYLFGVETQADPDIRGHIEHWGEYPSGPIEEPADWRPSRRQSNRG